MNLPLLRSGKKTTRRLGQKATGGKMAAHAPFRIFFPEHSRVRVLNAQLDTIEGSPFQSFPSRMRYRTAHACCCRVM